MKMRFIVIIAALLFTVAAEAQVNLGIKGGLNLYKISVDEGDETDLKPGANIGLLAHIHVSDNFALQPEVYYSNQGAKSEGDGDDVKLNLNYINIPLLFQYMFDNGFRIQAGPQIGILASAKAKVGDNSADVKDSFNTIELGVPVGVSYVSPANFGIDARYNIGLSNINEGDESKAYNRGFQVGVFYIFSNH